MFLRGFMLACLALMLSTCGERPVVIDGAAQKVAEARARNDGPALWVAKDYDSTVYLFGTVHLLPAGRFILKWIRAHKAKFRPVF